MALQDKISTGAGKALRTVSKSLVQPVRDKLGQAATSSAETAQHALDRAQDVSERAMQRGSQLAVKAASGASRELGHVGTSAGDFARRNPALLIAAGVTLVGLALGRLFWRPQTLVAIAAPVVKRGVTRQPTARNAAAKPKTRRAPAP